jgi:glycosyltransferase involved in cell wall biosynthesis
VFTLSIALVTRNRPQSLELTLHSLSLQQPKPFEIILSDDSDKEAAIVQNKLLAEKYGCTYIIGPHKGLYANRNFVAMHTNGTHFRTMDDDHEFPENHLKICMEAINKEPETIWTIGEYKNRNDIHDAPHPIPGQLHPRGYAYSDNNIENYYGISCGATIYPNTVLRYRILNNEFYMFGSTFLEYGARLKAKGYKILPLNTTYIIHNALETSSSFWTINLIKEAKLYAMFCFSFWHYKSLKNKIVTTGQILFELLTSQVNLKIIKSAWLNFRRSKQETQYY